MSLQLVPISLKEANAFVERHHRHHGPLGLGALFAVACAEAGVVVGVAVIGRPAARYVWDGYTLEVRRLCTVGHRNACSMLYAAAWRAARALGYRRLVTYTLPDEGGASLRAAGWRLVAQTGGDTWNRPGASRPRVDLQPNQERLRWEMAA
jgi:L-amino acid N-acyltransferase YncA